MQTIINTQLAIRNKRTNTNYDLEDRTTHFGVLIVRLCKKVPKNVINQSIVSQLIRSAGSVGANYREANDALGKKDFILRLKITRKECKETIHWLTLFIEANLDIKQDIESLIKEAIELKKIFSAIIQKSQN